MCSQGTSETSKDTRGAMYTRASIEICLSANPTIVIPALTCRTGPLSSLMEAEVRPQSSEVTRRMKGGRGGLALSTGSRSLLIRGEGGKGVCIALVQTCYCTKLVLLQKRENLSLLHTPLSLSVSFFLPVLSSPLPQGRGVGTRQWPRGHVCKSWVAGRRRRESLDQEEGGVLCMLPSHARMPALALCPLVLEQVHRIRASRMGSSSVEEGQLEMRTENIDRRSTTPVVLSLPPSPY